MEETQKPFVCKADGCDMSFTNEDHLVVHTKKHTMSLTLGLSSKAASFVADQTPTPTRLIRNCEEIGLFEMLNHVNPFDETFRRAVEAKSTATTPNDVATGIGDDNAELTTLEQTQQSHHHHHDGNHAKGDETLNTPHVLPYYDVTAADCRFVASPLEQRTSLCETVDKWRSNVAVASQSSSSVESKTKPITSMASDVDEKSLTTTAAALPVDDSTANNASPATSTSSGVMRMPKLVRLSPPATAVIEKRISPVIVHVQVLKAVPKLVQLSNAQPTDESEKQPIPDTSPPDTTTIHLDDSDDTETESPQTMTPAPTTTTSQTIRDKLKRQIYDKTKTDDDHPPVQSKRPLLTASPELQLPSTATEVPEEPKQHAGQRFERNRAAAQRYRSKMKEWKVEMQKNNGRLEEENRSLRAEVARLNALLLAHQKCSVTKAMEQGNSIPVGPPRIIIRTAGSSHHQTDKIRAIRPRKHLAVAPVTANTLHGLGVTTATATGGGDVTTNPIYFLVNQNSVNRPS